MGGYPHGCLMPGESYREFQESQARHIGYALPQYVAFDYEHLNRGEPTVAGQGCAPDGTTEGRVEWPDWQDHIMSNGKTWRETVKEADARVDNAMEKDWNEYVAGVRAKARQAATKYTDYRTSGIVAEYNGEGRCHETGIEDFVSKGMGPNMVEMNDTEPAPLKVGALPPCPSAEELVKEREQTHGDFTLHALITQDLKAVLRKYGYLTKLKAYQREALDMDMHKVGRILAGDPDFPDHWADIAGYSWLVADRCK